MIPLNFGQINEEENAQVMWCMMANARKGIKTAIVADDHDLTIYFAASLAAYNDVLALAAPEDLRPDGSETAKP